MSPPVFVVLERRNRAYRVHVLNPDDLPTRFFPYPDDPDGSLNTRVDHREIPQLPDREGLFDYQSCPTATNVECPPRDFRAIVPQGNPVGCSTARPARIATLSVHAGRWRRNGSAGVLNRQVHRHF